MQENPQTIELQRYGTILLRIMLAFNVFDPLEVLKPRKKTPRFWKISHKSVKRILNGINPSAMDRCGASALFGLKAGSAKKSGCFRLSNRMKSCKTKKNF